MTLGPTLAARDITVKGRLLAVSAELRAGEVTAICGPNGAGKSSLLAALAGLLKYDNGEVLLGGQPLACIAPEKRAKVIGYLPQAPEIAWDVSVETLVSLGRLPWKGAPAGETAQAIEDAIAAMDLADLRRRPVSRLSGGERARALAARVLAGRPQWLMADEPLANLDLAHAASLMARLKDQARGGAGVLLVLHDLAGAMNHADRVLVLEAGRLVGDGKPADTLGERAIAQTWGVSARWLGEPGMQALALR